MGRFVHVALEDKPVDFPTWGLNDVPQRYATSDLSIYLSVHFSSVFFSLIFFFYVPSSSVLSHIGVVSPLTLHKNNALWFIPALLIHIAHSHRLLQAHEMIACPASSHADSGYSY